MLLIPIVLIAALILIFYMASRGQSSSTSRGSGPDTGAPISYVGGGGEHVHGDSDRHGHHGGDDAGGDGAGADSTGSDGGGGDGGGGDGGSD